MPRTPDDAIKIPRAIASGLADLGLYGRLDWVTPRLLASLAQKPFRLLRRGWSLTSEPFGYSVGGKSVGQFLQIDRAAGKVVLNSRTYDCWHRVEITTRGELVSSGPAYA